MKISYECSDLIEELKQDILELGDIDMYAFFDKIDDYLLLTDYDLIVNEMPLDAEEVQNSIVQIMKASKILETLEKQNSII